MVQKIVDSYDKQKPLKLLDLGGGTGKFCEDLKTNWNITIADITTELLEQAENIFKTI